MSDESVRITRLEQDVQELRLDQKSILTALSRIELEIARFPRCSAPNTCLTLGENQSRLTTALENIETRLRVLESAESKVSGGLKVLIFLGTIGGAAVGALTTFILKGKAI